ncbi:Dna repair and recombination protein rada [Thalictrum thalictroides]|uniref:Dna repair and recombination protein rada n=1 Tax=Thalictrum thalictroides TaxID=46969 RepID=A0A7J6VJ52_THATH|nr:Dna repair and recombination protein rada [Thalictrum thalictroides]
MKPENLLNLSSHKCTTGCLTLDKFLSGGIPCNSITEIVSESGCGKTQISLQFLLSAQLPISHGGLSSSSLFIHSEYPFPFRRLHQLTLSFLSSNPNVFSSSYNPLDHIFVRDVQSAEELIGLLAQIDRFIENPPSPLPVRLIVIDSIAALFRSEFDNTPKDLKRRSSLFFKIASMLKLQAKKFNLAVLITNQVVDFIGNDVVNGMRVGNLGCLYTSGRRVCPALGLSWANCVNSRLFMSRNVEIVGKETDLEEPIGGVRTRRKLQVVFAPHLPESSCEFVVLREGVFGVDS